MKIASAKHHVIDFLFPIVLFFLFTICAAIIVLLAGRVYQSSVEHATRNNDARTALSYITEKVHQNDSVDTIYLGTFDGCQALIFKQEYNSISYYTYIYAHNGMLKELFIKEGANATAENGKAILDIQDFSIESRNDHLLKCNCTDKNGTSESMLIGVSTKIN